MLSSSLFYVQPWLDMKGVNSSLVVVARSESSEVAVTVRGVAEELWDRRSEFNALIGRVPTNKSPPYWKKINPVINIRGV